MKSMDKQQKKWQSFLSELSPLTRARLAGEVKASTTESEELESRSLKAKLTPTSQKILEDVAPPADGMPTNRKPMYGLVEALDGEYATLKMYSDAEKMARRLKELEGEDVVVHMFYGFPIPITKLPYRVMILPNETSVCLDPVIQTVRSEDIDRELILQDDGFLGDPELAHSSKFLSDTEIDYDRDSPDAIKEPEPEDEDSAPEDDNDDFESI